MKKNYESPKAEKMEFNYAETVVASNTIMCNNETTLTDSNAVGEYCYENTKAHTVSDVMPS